MKCIASNCKEGGEPLCSRHVEMLPAGLAAALSDAFWIYSRCRGAAVACVRLHEALGSFDARKIIDAIDWSKKP